MNNEIALKPCPFCHEPIHHSIRESYIGASHDIYANFRCEKCRYSMQMEIPSEGEHAVNSKWNTRVYEEAIGQELLKLLQQLGLVAVKKTTQDTLSSAGSLKTFL